MSWFIVFKVTGLQRFWRLSEVMKLVVVVSYSNAEVERAFSMVELSKTKTKNVMVLDRILAFNHGCKNGWQWATVSNGSRMCHQGIQVFILSHATLNILKINQCTEIHSKTDHCFLKCQFVSNKIVFCFTNWIRITIFGIWPNQSFTLNNYIFIVFL